MNHVLDNINKIMYYIFRDVINKCATSYDMKKFGSTEIKLKLKNKDTLIKEKRNIKTQYIQLLDLLIFLHTLFYLIYIYIFLLYHMKGRKDLYSNLYC